MDATEAVKNILAHHGVKGQKWGVRRKATVGAQEVVISDKGFRGKKVKTRGGSGHPIHSDAARAATVGQIAKKSGHKALSNKDLMDFNQRLNLEQQAKRLAFQDQSRAVKFIKTATFRGAGKGAEAGGKALLNSAPVKRRMAKGAAALALALP